MKKHAKAFGASTVISAAFAGAVVGIDKTFTMAVAFGIVFVMKVCVGYVMTRIGHKIHGGGHSAPAHCSGCACDAPVAPVIHLVTEVAA